MARPLFMICSESGSLDKYSNCVSAYSIIESIQVAAVAEGMPPPEFPPTHSLPPRSGPAPLRIVATWIGDDDDKGVEFEYKTTIQLNRDGVVSPLGSGTFIWNSRNHRFLTLTQIQLTPAAEFVLLKNAIRRTGSKAEWLQQEYCIAVEVIDAPELVPPNP